jgi:hypothetical protein
LFDFGGLASPSISPVAEIVVAASSTVERRDRPVVVDEVNHMRGAPPVAYNRNRINNHPRIAIAQNGKDKGRIYVTYTSMVAPVSGIPVVVPCPVPSAQPCVAQNLTSSQAHLSYSDDRGNNWSTPVPIAGPVPAQGVKRIWPTVSVEPGGNVDIVYYESLEEGLTPDAADIECNLTVQGGVRRAGTAVSLVDTWWARSSDGGASFKAPVRVSDVSTNWCEVASNIIPNMGDYIFSVSRGTTSSRRGPTGNGVPDTFFRGRAGRREVEQVGRLQRPGRARIFSAAASAEAASAPRALVRRACRARIPAGAAGGGAGEAIELRQRLACGGTQGPEALDDELARGEARARPAEARRRARVPRAARDRGAP